MKPLQNTETKDPAGQSGRRKFFQKSLLLTTGVAFFTESSFASVMKASASGKSKEEIFSQLDELVDKYFPIFGTCSQTSFYALNEVFDLKSENIVKALAPFPGIAARGETCGSVTGSLLAIALIYEDNNVFSNKKKLSMSPSVNFCSQFEGKFGSTRCRDVIAHETKTKYDITKPGDYKKPEEDGAFEKCPGVIKQAVHFAAEMILQKS